MKHLLRPHILIVGAAVLALLGWSTVSAATGALGARHHVVREGSVQTERLSSSPTPAAQAPELENQQPAEDENENEDQNEDENEDEANENPAPPTATAATSSRTFNLVGGTVTFTCAGNTIALGSAAPAAGFSVETETEDGGQEIKVRFENDAHRSEIRAMCSAGQVQATEIREESH